MKPWLAILALACASSLAAQPKRVLHVTHSAGFRHDSTVVSAQVMRSVAAESGRLEVMATEDVSLLNAQTLRDFDAVFFFTSGELPVSAQQKRDLLDFVRSGKGFGGAHSATDTFYSWPEYGDLIGGYFDGHPWVQPVRIDVEDPNHPAVAHLTPSFTILEEIYQFRDFSRERVRVILSLEPRSVDLKAPGVHPDTEDFPLAWVRRYGSGRVFYTALGHFDETWRDSGFQKTLLGAMLWLTGQVEGDATPRPQRKPVLAADAVANAASFTPRATVSPGSLITLFGQNLTDGAVGAAADPRDPPPALAGTTLKVNGATARLLYASPAQVNAFVPLELTPRPCIDTTLCRGPYLLLDLVAGGGGTAVQLDFAPLTPGFFTLTATRSFVTLWATGLGAVERRGSLDWTTMLPGVVIGGATARIQFSGLAPGWLGLYQVNAEVPANTSFPAPLEFRMGPYVANAVVNPQ
jgi:hypothetical protein